MASCECKSSVTGADKERYATLGQAALECDKFARQKRSEGDKEWHLLNPYYCPAGDCWHVGRTKTRSAPVSLNSIAKNKQPTIAVRETANPDAPPDNSPEQSAQLLKRIKETAATFVYVGLGLSMLAGEKVLSGLRNWLGKAKVPK